MTDQAKPRGDYLRILPGVLVSLGALTVLLLLIDWDLFWTALKQADYRYLLLALPVYFVSYLVRSRSWHILLMEEPPFKQVFLIEQAGYLMNNVLPFRLGEVGRGILMGQQGLGFWQVLSTIVVQRAFDLILAVGLFLGTLPFVAAIPGAKELGLVVGVIVASALGALYLLARYRMNVMAWVERLGERWPKLIGFAGSKIGSFLAGLQPLTDFRRFLRVVLWLGASWMLAILSHYLILSAFLPDAQLLWMAFTLSVGMLGIALPSSPGFIGVYEAAFVSALSFFGVPFESALAFALVDHALYVALTGVIGAYALVKEGQSLGQLFKRIRNRAEDEPEVLIEENGVSDE